MSTISGTSSSDNLVGTSSADNISGGSGNDILSGLSGSDNLSGGSGNDVLSGGSGNDELSGGSGNDLLLGGSGNDELSGGSGNDLLFGGSGNDELEGGSGNDILFGGTGYDELEGGSGNDILLGGSGNDELEGGSGDDILLGGSGNDELEGDSGNDILIGGAGVDWLEGGSGCDVFGFLNASDSSVCAWDRILDFKQGQDKIDLSALLCEENLAWGNQSAIANGAWFLNSGSSTFVLVDLTGNGKADFKIELKDSYGLKLTADDFLGVGGAAPAITSDGGGDSALRTVNENSTAVTTVKASDPDAGAVLTFSIVGGADAAQFSINSVTGALSFASAPNSEAFGDAGKNNVYDVIVQVSDGQGGVDTQAIAVALNDMDEFDVTAPMDDDGAGNAADENAGAGTMVGVTALAADADATTNSVSYLLTDDADGAFQIDALTGVITVLDGSKINRESDASLDVTVRATSADGSHADQTFAIAVNDVDEFDVTTPADNDGASNAVDENAAAGTMVGVAAFALDGDATTNSVSYSLTDDAGGRFEIDGSTGVVTVAGAIDREADGPSLNITVQAVSADGSTASQTFAIAVGDVDEFDVASPTDNNVAANAVDENSAVGTVVGVTAFASDADATNNAVSYSLMDDAGGRFAIDSSNGQVTVAGAIDREADASLDITVRATSADGSHADQTFAIAVGDLNDVAPTITSGDAVNVDGGTSNAAVVYDAEATDPDTVGTVTFSLTGTDAGLFSIDADNGEVRFLASPDFAAPGDADADNVYDIVVHANDGMQDTAKAVAITVVGPLFTQQGDIVKFNDVEAGTYISGTQYDALDGNDIVTLPTNITQANDAGFDPTQTFHGGAGDDTITSPGNLASAIDGGAGNDSLSGGGGNDTLEGGAGNDTLNGGAGTDTASYANAGGVAGGMVVDLAGKVAVDQGSPGLDTDTLSSIENVTGSAFNDLLNGDGNANVLDGGAGDDQLSGDAGNDTLQGGEGADALVAGAGNDMLFGGAGGDPLATFEYLEGGTGNDTLDGGAGDDVLVGDDMSGSIGSDIFDYNALADAGTAGDLILDFQRGSDKLDLHDLLTDFAGYDGTNAFSGYLQLDTSNAMDTVVRVDSDGAGGADAVTLATVFGVQLDASDFVL